MGRKLILHVDYDQDAEVPGSENDEWKVISFGHRHVNYEDPHKYLPPKIGLRRKLAVGLAFYLSYYEHGLCRWSLNGEGSNDPWDSVGTAGIIIWTGKPGDIGAKTIEDRKKDARSFLEQYTDWANGSVYWYRLETPDGEDVDQDGGLYGSDHLEDSLSQALQPGDVVTIEGDGDVLAYFDWKKLGVTVVEDFEEAV